MQKHKSGRNKGFGFTTFETEEDLERALQASTRILLLTYSVILSEPISWWRHAAAWPAMVVMHILT